ncbi:MAG: hypothetical protein A2541_02080 [Candidatus Taylorbacteria bacterium RIFOXYD2_FULL_36_9]|uniref:Uncharacterized protein n=1 Tax=Candidatus Taylorbacteria bacterium RIFOXYD2_FULL_36_9 TaxID=1802338 RepID=A0A1G2PHT2_9BACT|nr:MAG: hypothetical protein A2541_02080 [Candidatus Taylorbacteria bacterium RIFOXYD2_FULL_36_9]
MDHEDETSCASRGSGSDGGDGNGVLLSEESVVGPCHSRGAPFVPVLCDAGRNSGTGCRWPVATASGADGSAGDSIDPATASAIGTATAGSSWRSGQVDVAPVVPILPEVSHMERWRVATEHPVVLLASGGQGVAPLWWGLHQNYAPTTG